MKTIQYTILMLMALFLTACSTVNTKGHMPDKSRMHLNPIPPLNETQKVLVARITYYNKREAGGDRLASSNGRAKEGITVAAHPNFAFGTKLVIPALKGKVGNGEFICQDHGSAVTAKKASHGKAYVFDVYINANTLKEAKKKEKELEHQVGDYAEVYILKPHS